MEVAMNVKNTMDFFRKQHFIKANNSEKTQFFFFQKTPPVSENIWEHNLFTKHNDISAIAMPM